MAFYPASNKTFTLKANGQTVDASHVNDLQEEVAAIEDGLLNGSARLNSSHSTVVSLSVTGGSTFAGNLTIPNVAFASLPSTVTAGSVARVTDRRLVCLVVIGR